MGPLPGAEKASKGLWLIHIFLCSATVWHPEALKVNVWVGQTEPITWASLEIMSRAA